MRESTTPLPALLVQRMPGRRTVSAGVWVAHGAAHEPTDLAGVTHLVEHLTLRKCGRRSRHDLAVLVDQLGGDVDAWTASESMGISLQTTTEAVPEAIALLRDAVLEPTFDPADVDLEKRVALAEMDLVRDDPVEQVEEAILTAAWGDHALARPIIGFRSTLQRLEPDVVRRHHQRMVQSGRLVVAVAGDVEQAEIARILVDLPLGQAVEFPPLDPLRWVGGRLRVTRQDCDQAHVRVVFPGLPIDHPSVPALTVLNRVFGVGASSRLFQRLREDEGLTYDIWSALVLRSLGGLLEIGWACAPEVLPDVWRLVKEEIRSTLEGLTLDEVEIAKEGLDRGLLIDSDSTGGVCSMDVAEVMDRNRRFDLERIRDELRAVTADHVVEVARSVISTDTMATAVCGPDNLIELEW